MDRATNLRVSGYAGWEAADWPAGQISNPKSPHEPRVDSVKPTCVQISANLYQLMVGML